MRLDGPRHGVKAGPGKDGRKARALVVFLHGLGADGNDLISLAPLLESVLPDTAFASPHAPFPCDMAPLGRQWFSLQDRDPDVLLAGVQAAAPLLNAFLDQELKAHGLSDERLALVGFSQGTMIALHVALRRPRPCAGPGKRRKQTAPSAAGPDASRADLHLCRGFRHDVHRDRPDPRDADLCRAHER